MVGVVAAQAFIANPSSGPQPSRRSAATAGICYSTAVPRGPKRRLDSSSFSEPPQPPPGRVEFVDFWGTHVQHTNHDQGSLELPVDSGLDRFGGPLPLGAYQIHGKLEFDPKPLCRIALGIDWKQRHSRFARMPLGADEVVRQVQDCIEAGFQTFQLLEEQGKAGASTDMIGRIIKETPSFVEMHWILPLQLPKAISAATVREAVLALLITTKSDCLDTLLIPFDPSILPQYHLDVLDVLQDLQREGLVRSVGVENWTEELLKQAKSCGLAASIDVHQQSGNLLLPPPRSMMKNGSGASLWTNPLARNFLSNNLSVLTVHSPPTHAKGWSDVQRWYDLKHQKRRLRKDDSAGAVASSEVWKTFQKEVHEPLRDLARKHEVSIASVVLRWSLQERSMDKKIARASSVLYPLFLVDEPEGQLSKQLRDLRDVFRFELDEEDLELLCDIVALPKPKATTLRIDEVDVPVDDIPIAFLKEFESMHAGKDDDDEFDAGIEDDDYPKIDFSNPALWL